MNGNRQSEPTQTDGGYRRHLPEYSQLGDMEFNMVLDRFKPDMEMFGYTYQRDNRTGEVYATCVQSNCQW